MDLGNFKNRCAGQKCSHGASFWRRFRGITDGAFLQDRWYCSPDCVEQALLETLSHIPVEVEEVPPRHRVPIGLLMVSHGLLHPDALREALRYHQENREVRLGNRLLQMGAIDEHKLATGLSLQWSCPLFPATAQSWHLRHPNLVPYAVLKRIGMVPVSYNKASGVLHMAFSTGIDHAALYAVEQVVECRTEPCISTESFVQASIDELGQIPRADEFVFERMRDVEIARTTRSYAMQLGAERILWAGCKGIIWIRLHATRTTDLVFSRSVTTDVTNDALRDRRTPFESARSQLKTSRPLPISSM